MICDSVPGYHNAVRHISFLPAGGTAVASSECVLRMHTVTCSGPAADVADTFQYYLISNATSMCNGDGRGSFQKAILYTSL